MSKLKTSNEWYEEERDKYVIIDPDGWDRRNYEYSFYEEKIDKDEYNHRLLASTIMRQLDIEEELRLKNASS